MTRINWHIIISTIASGLALAAAGGWISTRDAARDAYATSRSNEQRLTEIEVQFRAANIRHELTGSEIPRIQSDIATIREKQDWMVGVLYDLARAVNPKLPIDKPPRAGGKEAR